MSTLAAIFVALTLTAYVALTAVGLYCAVISGRIVEKALGRNPNEPLTAYTFLTLIVAFAVIWISGLAAVLGTGGIHQHIARGAELHTNKGIGPDDRRKIRSAVKEYRKRHGLT